MRHGKALSGLACGLFFLGASAIARGQERTIADRAYREDVLRQIADLVERRYVLAEKAGAFAGAFRALARSGAYDGQTDPVRFAEKVTADLIEITRDKHLNFRVVVPSDVGEEAPGSLHHAVRYARLRLKENVGFTRLDWIEPGIGYLDLRRFYSFDQARDMVLAAMTFLRNARAIIIDVRENGGGSGDYLSSFFLPYPTELSGSFCRETGVLTESWTSRDVGQAPRLEVPLFILIGPNTFSAAESFAYDMRSRKRATLIGEPTKGGAHSVDLFPVGDGFEFYISTERSISPVTGGNWEGTGVVPDIRVPAEAALGAGLREARKAAEAYGREQDAGLRKAVAGMQGLADRAAELYRKAEYRGAAAALDVLVAEAGRVGLLSEFFMNVFAYSYQAPEDQRMLLSILEKSAALHPRSPTAWATLAAAYDSRGKKELALRSYRKVLKLDPDQPGAAKRIRELSR